MMRLSVRRPGAMALMAALALVLRGTLACAQDSSTTVRIGLTYAPGTKPGVLVLPVNGNQGDSIKAILQRDLEYGDRINVIASDALVGDSTDGARGQFNFPLYARLGAMVMVQATATETGVHVAVHDVRTQKLERVKDFALAAAPQSPEWRQQVHAISDAVEFWVTGVKGIATSRVLYSSGGRIWQVDSDGANATALTANSPPAFYPAWHPKATRFAYTVMTDDGMRVMVRDLGANNAGATKPLLPRVPAGTMNNSPTFSPDGETILYANGLENGTDIFAVSANGGEPPRRVTVSRGNFIAVSPSFSPDGRRIVYASDKAGGLALYVSDADGTNAEALTPYNYGDRTQRTDPSWSPDGRFISFAAEIDGAAQIYTVRPGAGGVPRQYTNQGRNEDPSWSPDSRHLVFTSNRSGAWQLWVLDIETGTTRQLTRAASGAKHGAWSPRLFSY